MHSVTDVQLDGQQDVQSAKKTPDEHFFPFVSKFNCVVWLFVLMHINIPFFQEQYVIGIP